MRATERKPTSRVGARDVQRTADGDFVDSRLRDSQCGRDRQQLEVACTSSPTESEWALGQVGR